MIFMVIVGISLLLFYLNTFVFWFSANIKNVNDFIKVRKFANDITMWYNDAPPY